MEFANKTNHYLFPLCITYSLSYDIMKTQGVSQKIYGWFNVSARTLDAKYNHISHEGSGISCVKVFVFRFRHPSGLPPDFLPKKQAQLRTMLLDVAEAVEHHFGNAHVAPRRFGRREHFIAQTLEFRFALIPSIRQ